MGWLRRMLGGVLGERLPAELSGRLAAQEHVLGWTRVGTGGYVAVTALGLWVPDGGEPRRIGWDLVSKAVWRGDVLTVTEAEVTGRAGRALVLADRAPMNLVLPRPGRIPHLVRQRVEGSIRSRYRKDLPGGGAWFVLRKVPGADGVVLQVRPDQGAEVDTLAEMAQEAAEKLAEGQT